MPPLRSQEEIRKDWGGSNDPLVSIRCLAFNHGAFIESALRGFLEQRTRFPFEILVHDDASTDGTQDVIRAYQRAYPDLIRPVLQTENQYARGRRGWQAMDPLTRGRYVALCEGDDYWTDPYKLQIQVDFLERHPEYVISGHDARVVDEEGSLVSASKLARAYRRDFSASDLERGNSTLLTLSWVYRNLPIPVCPERGLVANGDRFFLVLLGAYGKSHHHDDIEPAVYRVHSGGVWSALSRKEQHVEQAHTWCMIQRYFRRIGRQDLARHFLERCQGTYALTIPLPRLLQALVFRSLDMPWLRRWWRRLGGFPPPRP